MADRFKITYVDGSSVDVDRRPVHMMRGERAAGTDSGVQEFLLATLWAAATGGTGTAAEFEAWCEQVEDWARSEVSDDPPDSGSSTSQS